MRRQKKKCHGYTVSMLILGLVLLMASVLYLPHLRQVLGAGTPDIARPAQKNQVIIPKLKLTLPLFDATTEQTLAKGATLWQGKFDQRPVITAHSGITNHPGFDRLDTLKKGDRFVVFHNSTQYTYTVTQKKTVRPAAVDSVKPIAGQSLATLVTCTPYMVNSHRLLVTGRRVKSATSTMSATITQIQRRQEQQIWKMALLGISGLLLFAGFAVGLTWYHKRRTVWA